MTTAVAESFGAWAISKRISKRSCAQRNGIAERLYAAAGGSSNCDGHPACRLGGGGAGGGSGVPGGRRRRRRRLRGRAWRWRDGDAVLESKIMAIRRRCGCQVDIGPHVNDLHKHHPSELTPP
ncbi:hypothetical protein EJB05_44089 [Eragrostis curvula]|uniref:Uncharacterized protein n=1 Tax=Eragrostis curvula TaxID=38414 RepID=A0A5J9T5D5_9POAL|nr:hypothetical protein EJB05_49681 [Eragrostis curvula]TVU10548.1 hypothetical protein EJB05_44089 [Eragrostis curvula]